MTVAGTTLRKKTARQPRWAVSAPPISGPAAADRPMALVRSARGMPSASGGYVARSIPRVAGWSSAPKTPWAIRRAITQPIPDARPMPAEAAPKPRMPTEKTRWWP